MNYEQKLDMLDNDKKPNFCIYLDFPPNAKNPQRIFQTAANYISALQEMDSLLVSPIESQIRTVLLLEEMEIGSLKIWLKQFIDAIDDDALKNLDWKPSVGKYLVKCKYIILQMLSKSKSLPPENALKQLSLDIQKLAQKTGVKRLPVYSSVSTADLAQQAKNISTALRELESEETISYISNDGKISLGVDFMVVQEDIDKLLAANTIENNIEMILMVRKPDFLGETQWEFRYQKIKMSASIKDTTWLDSFHSGEIDIRPGDKLRVLMHESVSYSAEGEVVEERREINEVRAVIKQQKQPIQLEFKNG